MNTFNELEQAWQQQAAPGEQRPSPAQLVQLAEQQARKVKAKFRFTIALLSLTVLVIACYFSVYAGFRFSAFAIGLLLMMGSLLLRIVLEWISTLQFARLDLRADFTTCLQQLTDFYRRRRLLHWVITPLLYAAYTVGFVLLLPTFRREFADGFYYYLLATGFGSLVVLAWVIVRANRRELKILAGLQRSGEVMGKR